MKAQTMTEDPRQPQLASYQAAGLDPADFAQAARLHALLSEGCTQSVNWRLLVKALKRIPELRRFPPDTINDIATLTAELVGLTKTQYVDAALHQPQLLHRNPETIDETVTRAARLLGMPKAAYVKAARRVPCLFFRSLETLNANLDALARMSGVPRSRLAKAGRHNPWVFGQRPETLMSNATESASRLGLSIETFKQALSKKPYLFTHRPQTLDRNITALSELLQVPKADVIAAAFRQPGLFSISAKSIATKLPIIMAIAEAHGTPMDNRTILERMPTALGYSAGYLRLRLTLARAGYKAGLLSLIAYPTKKAQTFIENA